MDAYRAGNVTITNAVGTGIADDKAIYTYVPEIIDFYLGEKAILNNVPTWRCREPGALRYVQEHLAELVVKEVNGSGGYGMLVGPHASKSQIELFAGKLARDPDNFIAQPTLALSTTPDALRYRHRAPPCRFAALRSDRHEWHAGRAGRIDKGCLEREIARGEFEPGRRHQGHLDRRGFDFRRNSGAARSKPNDMISKRRSPENKAGCPLRHRIEISMIQKKDVMRKMSWRTPGSSAKPVWLINRPERRRLLDSSPRPGMAFIAKLALLFVSSGYRG